MVPAATVDAARGFVGGLVIAANTGRVQAVQHEGTGMRDGVRGTAVVTSAVLYTAGTIAAGGGWHGARAWAATYMMVQEGTGATRTVLTHSLTHSHTRIRALVFARVTAQHLIGVH